MFIATTLKKYAIVTWYIINTIELTFFEEENNKIKIKNIAIQSLS